MYPKRSHGDCESSERAWTVNLSGNHDQILITNLGLQGLDIHLMKWPGVLHQIDKPPPGPRHK